MVDVALVGLMLLVVGCLILPAIASMRGDESRLRCADNLRQIGVALDTYQTIEGGQLPVVEASGPMGHAGVFAMLLQARELVPDVRLLICPMADSAVVYVPRLTEYLAQPADSILQKLQAREMAGSYGYTLGYVDEKGYHAQHRAGSYSPIVSDRPARSGERVPLAMSPNHLSQGQNVLFADGHVRWLFDAKLGKDDLFRNNKGQVGAGIGEGDICIGVSEAVPFPASEAATSVPAR
jgi:prepilin-type processing-associated H-X9-DG protein